MENSTRVICPSCGAEFEIPEKSRISTGMVIGKDSNLGTIHPKVVNQNAAPNDTTNRAQARIDALKAAGVDTSNLLAITLLTGERAIGRFHDGNVDIVSDDDPVFNGILNGGTIPERRLFRRWVMSQMFHMLVEDGGFNKALRNKGYEYSWKMLIEELRVQSKLEKTDMENFLQRNRWFNRAVAKAMADDYVKKFRKHVSALPVKHCKGVPYKRIHSKDYFCDDLEKKLFEPLETTAKKIGTATNCNELLAAVNNFNRIKDKLKWDTRMSSCFVSAYKGSGAYFTLRNLILFHDCRLYDNYVRMSKEASLKKLEAMADSFRNDGYKLFAVMNKAIDDNDIDIRAKMAGWAN